MSEQDSKTPFKKLFQQFLYLGILQAIPVCISKSPAQLFGIVCRIHCLSLQAHYAFRQLQFDRLMCNTDVGSSLIFDYRHPKRCTDLLTIRKSTDHSGLPTCSPRQHRKKPRSKNRTLPLSVRCISRKCLKINDHWIFATGNEIFPMQVRSSQYIAQKQMDSHPIVIALYLCNSITSPADYLRLPSIHTAIQIWCRQAGQSQ